MLVAAFVQYAIQATAFISIHTHALKCVGFRVFISRFKQLRISSMHCPVFNDFIPPIDSDLMLM